MIPDPNRREKDELILLHFAIAWREHDRTSMPPIIMELARQDAEAFVTAFNLWRPRMTYEQYPATVLTTKE